MKVIVLYLDIISPTFLIENARLLFSVYFLIYLCGQSSHILLFNLNGCFETNLTENNEDHILFSQKGQNKFTNAVCYSQEGVETAEKMSVMSPKSSSKSFTTLITFTWLGQYSNVRLYLAFYFSITKYPRLYNL